jgi:alkylation response protein AidB-like acyl-CoA dehydrogenase
MPFAFSEEECEFRRFARKVTEQEVAPCVESSHRVGHPPRELWKRMGEVGLLGVRYPEEVGGSGGSLTLACLAMEELCRVSPGIATGFEVHMSLGTRSLQTAGTAEQIERWLRPALRGDAICAFALTEPGAGSDVNGIRTTVKPARGGWVLNGSKVFITNGGIADFVVVVARSEHGLSILVVERGDAGFSAGPPFEKMGGSGFIASPLYFDSCFLPDDRLVGKEGQGLELVFESLDDSRLLVAAESLGIAKSAFERALAHAKTREQFGRPIGKFQAVRFRLADMAMTLEASEQLIYSVARRCDRGERCPKEVAMAKLFASEGATRIAHDALLTLGGIGYMQGSGVEQAYRDAVLNEIVEGTSDIQRVVIARELGL